MENTTQDSTVKEQDSTVKDTDRKETSLLENMLENDLYMSRITEANLLEAISKRDENIAMLTTTMLNIMDEHTEKAVSDMNEYEYINVLNRRKENASTKVDILAHFLKEI